MPKSLIQRIIRRLVHLNSAQIRRVNALIESFEFPIESDRNPASDIVTKDFADEFSETLRSHHCSSRYPLRKEHFEYAMESSARALGRRVALARSGNPGEDITIDSVRFSLKTQADAKIQDEYLHISKYMELGKGKWASEADLAGLRSRFLAHMENYDRILCLRAFREPDLRGDRFRYELVEIPKPLLQLSEHGTLRMQHKSTQTPKPGYCDVRDANTGELLYQLYFDGGTERKLQIKRLLRDRCIVHATWRVLVLAPASNGGA